MLCFDASAQRLETAENKVGRLVEQVEDLEMELEEEVVESRTSPMRRFVVRRPEPEIPVTLSDASGPLIREAIIDDTGDIER